MVSEARKEMNTIIERIERWEKFEKKFMGQCDKLKVPSYEDIGGADAELDLEERFTWVLNELVRLRKIEDKDSSIKVFVNFAKEVHDNLDSGHYGNFKDLTKKANKLVHEYKFSDIR